MFRVFREFQINIAKSFFSTAKYHAKVLICHPDYPQNLFLRLFFQVIGAQNPAIARGELLHSVRNCLAHLKQIGGGQAPGRLLRNALRHWFVALRSAAVFGNNVPANTVQERARRGRVPNLVIFCGNEKTRQRFLHDIIDIRAQEPHFIANLEANSRPKLFEILARKLHARTAKPVRPIIIACWCWGEVRLAALTAIL